jgi:hypothetical protein
MIDRTGRIVAGPFLYSAGGFTNGLVGVHVRNGEFFFIDSTGRTAIGPQPGARRWDTALSFDGGRAAVQIGDKWGYIDTTGAVVIEPRFEEAWSFIEGRAKVALGHKWGYIDTTGAVVIEPRFDFVGPFSEGLAAIRVDRNWGYIDTAGGIVIEPRYFWEGGDLRHRLTPSARDFSEGLAAVRTGTSWGYIDHAGEFVIPPQFDEAEPFEGGVARVRLGGWLFTWVDRAGRVLWDPRPGARE